MRSPTPASTSSSTTVRHRSRSRSNRRSSRRSRSYLIGFAQDTWRVGSRLTLELGLRYDFYSVVKEKDGLAKPFFIEENAFDTNPDNFYNADKNNFSPRVSAVYQLNDKTALRAGYGHFYGPGQFEDRIQPIENFIERRRVQSTDVPGGALAYPVDPAIYRNLLSVRGYTHERPDEYNVQYGASISRELPGAMNLTVGYTGSRGRDMFLRGVANTFDNVTRVRPVPSVGQVDYKTSGCLDGLVINGNAITGCGEASYDALQIGLSRRFRSGLTGGLQYQYSRNEGTTQGSNEAATAGNTFDYNTEFGPNLSDIPHTFNGSLIYMLPGEGFWLGGWRVGGIVNARSGVPINVTINRPDTVSVGGVTVTNVPGGNTRGTLRPDLVPGVDPYLKDGVRWLNPAAFAAPLPGTFGNLPRNFLRGPEFWQVDLMIEQGLPLRTGSGHSDPVRGLQHHQPAELREPGGRAARRHDRAAVHRRRRRHVRLHVGPAQPDRRTWNSTPDPGRDSVPLLSRRQERRLGRLPPLRSYWPSGLAARHFTPM